ncbi:hypothetical protein [Paraclostridium sordellii]|uniref:hypothetical protein n=1 Tax=Paraclostridium sordellii TaxID=1505 RepID=UPI0012D8184D|nr:hypothetical protein [Paeniclostridium sordellii]MDU6247340.1 hypothetical protein [Paeniclostridium sordellii]
MNLKKNFKAIVFILMISFVSLVPLTNAHAANKDMESYSVTAATKNLRGAKQVYGYVKDSNGNPVANKQVFVKLYDHYIESTEEKMVIKDFYDVVKTDSNGYYSLLVYHRGYYEIFVPSKTLTRSEVEKCLLYNGEWPSRFILEDRDYHACDSNAASYAL